MLTKPARATRIENPVSPERGPVDWKQLAPAIYTFINERTVVLLFFNGEGSPGVAGSGVLVQVDDAYFVLTAAHVIAEHAKEYTMGLGGMPGKPIFLQKEQANVSLDTESTDIGVVELSVECVSELKARGKVFTRNSTVLPGDQHEERALFAVCGYPSEDARLELQSDRKHVYLGNYVHVAKRAPLSPSPVAERFNFDPKKHLAVEYVEGQKFDGSDYIVKSPEGMSGGGVWRVFHEPRTDERWTTDDIKLVAIQHTHSLATKSVTGTRIQWMRNFIYQHYPQLRPALSVAIA